MLSSLMEALRDSNSFGLLTALKATGRKFGTGIIDLDLRQFGTLRVRCGDSDYATVRQTFRDQEYAVSEQVQEQLNARVGCILGNGRKPVIVDCGANVGVASRWFATLYPHATVVAIEPDPENAEVLRWNTSACQNIIVLEAAIGASPGYVSMSGGVNSWAITTKRAASGCPIVTVQDAVSVVDDGVLFIAKIDVEGFESDLFSENTQWVDEAEAVFIEPHDWMLSGERTSRNFQRVMAELDFDLHVTGENLLYVNQGRRAS